MDKYEYKVKLDQIEKMAAKKDYVTAAKIADGIDWRKVRSITTLTMIADIYEETNRLEDCYEILNMVYDRSPIGRRVVYRMAEIATKMHDFEEAIELYKEFIKIAPHDLNKYILKYQIYRERGSSVADQITILEEFKTHEYDEKWAYELACLYEEAGMLDHCIEECDELILWFSEGEYVVKAMELKMKYQELTASQQEKYEHRFDYEEQAEAEEVLPTEKKASEDILPEEVAIPEPVQEEVSDEKVPVEQEEVAVPVSKETDKAEDTPQVSMISVNKFSTINLQEELAKNLQELLAQVDEEEKEALEVEVEERPEEPEKVEEVIEEAAEEPLEAQQENGDTQEFIPLKVTVVEEISVEEEAAEEPLEAQQENGDTQEFIPLKVTVVEEISVEEEAAAEEVKNEKLSETAELQTEILKYVAVPQEPKMEELLRTEEDGQMSLAIGEENVLEKQITGQMTIGEILEAWEVKKREAREQIEASEAKKPAVLYETGEITSLLQDFMPRTPKDVQQILEEISEEAADELQQDDVQQEIPEETELEDDLPQDIDLEASLGAFLEEPQEEEKLVEETQTASIGQNTASMLDAIERALALEIAPMETAGTYLTEEQEEIFAYFTSVKGMKKQLITLLAEDRNYAGREDSKEGNLIITGHPGNGKTTLAIDIVKAFQKQRKVKGSKLAKVSGDGFNKKNPEDVIKKLGGGALIIERAGSLKDETVELLSEAMDGFTGGLLVILEDDSAEINRLLEKHAGFASKFNRSVDIPIFSNDELVAFGKSYAEEQEYFFDDMAVLALYDSIGVRQTSEHVVNITEVKEFIDDAIAHAEKKNKGFFAKLSKKRIDEYGNKLLLEEDFDS